MNYGLITKEEVFEVGRAKALLNDPRLPYSTKLQIKAYYKSRYNVNTVKVSYQTASDYATASVGRVYAQKALGLQSFEKDIRALLAQPYYHDIDIKNAQPTIALQACQKHGWPCEHLEYYVKNRAEVLKAIMEAYEVDHAQAKELIIRMLFMGGIDAWEKDHNVLSPGQGVDICKYMKNLQTELAGIAAQIWDLPENEVITKIVGRKRKTTELKRLASCMALYFQGIEHRILMALDRAMAAQGRRLDVLIFDGGLVRKASDDEEKFPTEGLRACEEAIMAETGYQVVLEQKPLKTTIKLATEPERIVIPKDVCVDDRYAAKRLVELMQGMIKGTADGLFVFDIDTGIWTAAEEALRKHVDRLGSDMVFYQQVGDGDDVKAFNYAGSEANFTSMKKWLSTFCSDKMFHERMANTGKGKLLFLDGIYDFETDTFTEGFDPNVVFFDCISRRFPRERDEEAVAKVNKILFEDPFMDTERDVATYLKVALARAIAGDYEAKKIYFCVGETNAGKGVMSDALGAAFEGYVGRFNGDSMVYNKANGQDSGKQRGWIMQFHNKRIAISHEMTLNRELDGNLIKSIVSGGDEIMSRQNFKDERCIVNRATLFCFVNDIPKIAPFDAAMQARATCPEFNCTFVENPKAPNERQMDPNVKAMFKSPWDDTYKDALVHVMRDAYKHFKEHGHPIPERVRSATQAWLSAESSVRAAILEAYDITGDEGDMVLAGSLLKFLTDKKLGSVNGVARQLTKLGIRSKDIRPLGHKTMKRVYLGIRKRGMDDDMLVQ